MHALSVSTHSAPRRRGLGAMARQVAVDLTPQAVEQVAGPRRRAAATPATEPGAR